MIKALSSSLLWIEQLSESQKIAYAFPELRCSFGIRSILVFRPGQQPELFQKSDRLKVLEEIDLELTVEQVFSWLKMENK